MKPFFLLLLMLFAFNSEAQLFVHAGALSRQYESPDLKWNTAATMGLSFIHEFDDAANELEGSIQYQVLDERGISASIGVFLNLPGSGGGEQTQFKWLTGPELHYNSYTGTPDIAVKSKAKYYYNDWSVELGGSFDILESFYYSPVPVIYFRTSFQLRRN